MTVTLRNDFTVELDHAAPLDGDDSVLRAMLVSTRKDSTVGDMSEEAKAGRINFLMKNRHGTPFEHNQVTFRVEAPIFVYREWHRHRIGISINEQSGRYTEFQPVFYIPPPERPLVQVGKPGAYEYVPGTLEQYDMLVSVMTDEAQRQWATYQLLLHSNIALEVARMSLGVNIYSSMYWTCNARSLMAFLSLRTRYDDATFPSKPMWEIDACARIAEQVFEMVFPLTHAAFNEHGRVAP